MYFNQFIPLPNTAARNGLVSNPLTAYDADQVTFRLDQEINANHRFFARLSRHYNTETDRAAFPALGSQHLKGPAVNWVRRAELSNIGNDHGARISPEPYVWAIPFRGLFSRARARQMLQEAGITGMELQDPAISSIPAFTISGYTGFSGNVGDGGRSGKTDASTRSKIMSLG